MKNEKLSRLEEVLKTVRKGSYVKLSWKSVYYDAKGHKLYKVTDGYGRLGVNYSHIEGVESMHEGLKGEQKWINNFFIYNEKNQQYKLRITKCLNSKNLKSKSYYIDEEGNIYNKASDIDYLPNSKRYPTYNNDIKVFDVSTDNIISVKNIAL